MKSLRLICSILVIGQGHQPSKHRKTRRIEPYFAHSDDSVLAAVPDTLDIDRLGQIPNALLRVESVVVSGVHNSSVVKHNVQSTKLVDSALNNSFNVGFFADVALDSYRFDWDLRILEALVDKICRLLACIKVNVRQYKASTFRSKENSTFSTNTSVKADNVNVRKSSSGRTRSRLSLTIRHR